MIRAQRDNHQRGSGLSCVYFVENLWTIVCL
jgi:hypothetical protein